MPTTKHFPAHWQDQPFYYLDQDLALFPVPPEGKGAYAGTHGHKDASHDPRQIREWQRQYRGECRWAFASGERSRRCALDVEQRGIRGQDGSWYLQHHAEALGLKESLVPYGRTPISLSPNGGFHIHFTWTGPRVASGVVLPYVELKADGASLRLPDAPGRRWDSSSPPDLAPLPVPEWLLALAHRKASAPHPPLPPEGPLNGQEATALGAHIAERIVAKALREARDMVGARAAARGLAWLASEDRISEGYARAALTRLAEGLPDFQESGFSRAGLARALERTYARGDRHGR
jgi:hypothetical protein